jgi:hypothetical protein
MSLTGVWAVRIFAVKENDGERFYVADGEWDLSGYAVKNSAIRSLRSRITPFTAELFPEGR